MNERPLWQELIAEAAGTALIVLFGCGVVAMVVLFGKGVPAEVVNGGYTNITFAWGLGVTLAVYATGKVSGAHLNPAVTLTLAVLRGFSWVKVGPYILAQTAGAFGGAAVVFWNYRPAFQRFDPALSKTAGIFATFPAFPEFPMAGFLDQVIGTAILLFCIFALTDDRNDGPSANLAPVLVGVTVIGIGMSFGALHGYAINPARDIGPRLFTVVAGFSNNGLTDGSGVFWVPVVAPMIGGLIGGAAYDLAIRRSLMR